MWEFVKSFITIELGKLTSAAVTQSRAARAPTPLRPPVLSCPPSKVFGLHREVGGQEGVGFQNSGRNNSRAVTFGDLSLSDGPGVLPFPGSASPNETDQYFLELRLYGCRAQPSSPVKSPLMGGVRERRAKCRRKRSMDPHVTGGKRKRQRDFSSHRGIESALFPHYDGFRGSVVVEVFM